MLVVSMAWVLFVSCTEQHTILAFNWVHWEFLENWKAMMLGKPVSSTQNGLNKKCSFNLLTFGAGFLTNFCFADLMQVSEIKLGDGNIFKFKYWLGCRFH